MDAVLALRHSRVQLPKWLGAATAVACLQGT